jgi:phage portal protein BeeE
MRAGKAGPEIQNRHPIDYLLWKRPSLEWSSFQFRETLTHWALRWGNGYAEIERNILGMPIALWPIHPERVWVMRDPETQVLYYSVANTNTSQSWAVRVDVPAEMCRKKFD